MPSVRCRPRLSFMFTPLYLNKLYIYFNYSDMTNPSYNRVSKGVLWSLWNFVPLLGPPIFIYKVLCVSYGPKAGWYGVSIQIAVSLFLGYVQPIGGAGIILIFVLLAILWIIIIKEIGWKFFAGMILTFILISGVISILVVPEYQDYIKRANESSGVLVEPRS